MLTLSSRVRAPLAAWFPSFFLPRTTPPAATWSASGSSSSSSTGSRPGPAVPAPSRGRKPSSSLLPRHLTDPPPTCNTMHRILLPSLSDLADDYQRSCYRLLVLVFFLVLAGYWLVRPIKMGLFSALVGIEHEPQAKLGTVAILVPVLFGYNHLYTRLQNPRQLVLIVGLFYAALFALIAAMANSAIASVKVQREMGTVPEYGHWLGWLVYWTIESYGSVVVPMLWSTTASITDSKAATIVYPLIVIFQQLGAVGGATLATYTKFFGFQSLVFFHALSIGLIVVLVRRALDINDVRNSLGRALEATPASGKRSQEPTGLLEGLRLICTRSYVAGIFVISTFAEIVSTIMDFQMKMIARQTYTDPSDFAAFMGRFGQIANAVSLALAVFGTQNIMKNFGLTTCLLAFPACTAGLIATVFVYPNLWVLFAGMVSIKALGYSLNGPSREMLYVRTSEDIKFKAKSWIDMFGTRGAKATGSIVNNTFRHSLDILLTQGSLVSSFFVAVWITAALRLSRLYRRYEAEDRLVD